MKIIADLKWVSELDDIDHDICDIAMDAIDVIEQQREEIKAMRQQALDELTEQAQDLDMGY
jgi:t-SNARE complex subunit (syntaxin)